MTYCVGMVLDQGLVLMSDTRTNSGVDNISVFRKMFHWSKPGDRVIAIMTAGNLATTQAVVSRLEERTKAPADRHNASRTANYATASHALLLLSLQLHQDAHRQRQ